MSYKDEDLPIDKKEVDNVYDSIEIPNSMDEKEIPMSSWERRQWEVEEDTEDLHEAGEMVEAIKEYSYLQGIEIGRKLTYLEMYNFLAYL